ncbi:MAG: ABC transporter ATP-binding protein [Oscillospiraceae bacterium]|jgi:iron complex transport system ATP-binding protein|nr:ABC transporter ATP-binding protein [Oscillospiraceae bacterium]
MLEVKDLSVRYGQHTILDRVGFSVREGQWLMIVGPNGAGKSTALSAISQTAPYTGKILLGGRDSAKWKPAARAKYVGVLTQNHHVGYSFSVGEVVKLGRYAHSAGMFSAKNSDDAQAVERALEITGLTAQQGQNVLTLSGGELQRVFLAQVFAQNPKLLLLDEPTNHLDLVYQKQIFSLVSQWLKQPGRAVVSVVHDLSLARAYGSHALLLHQGRCVSQGEAKSVLRAENLNAVYQMDVPAWMQGLFAQWQGE